MKKRKADNTLPTAAQIRAEIKEAEAMGIHKEPIDPLNDACMAEIVSGHLDESLVKPSIEELTR